ncbi:MAG TPA: class I SAM-dependent methyltransferase [Thermoleophilaceae bacterium]|jgi:methionine biosynthesis protein MetW|nr:class I SAM-dependent methyltransferase [Thermoleophilaceae bacterium]
MAIELRELRRLGYETERPEVQALVPRSASRVLDLGCASGVLGAALKARQGAEVVGIELSPDYAADAATRLDDVICADVAETLEEPEELGRFDCVVAADVLEHLVDPWTALERAAALLNPGGVAVVSLPNVQYALTFWTLLRRGTWPRDPAGLFDATHLRWFTLRDARALFEGAGLEVEVVEPRYWFDGWQLRVARQLARTPLAPFLAGQYVLRGRRPR